MKKLLPAIRLLFFLPAAVLLTGFAVKRQSNVKYAYVSALEYVKTGKAEHDYYNLYTNIVEIRCDHGHNEVERQLLTFYRSEAGTGKRDLVSGNHVNAWLYTSYDEAYAKRRSDMAAVSNPVRTIRHFYVTCD